MIEAWDRAPESSPTNAVEFEDHRRQLFYKLLENNTMGNVTRVTMKVVSSPVFTTGLAQAGVTGTGGFMGPFVGGAIESLNQIMFRGRIEPGDGFISPHFMWDDPCDVSLFRGDNTKLLAVISNHTLCVSKMRSPGGMVPKVGDKVTVTMKPSDVGPFSLQTLYFDEIEEIISPQQVAMQGAQNTRSALCGGLAQLFGVAGTGGFPTIDYDAPDFFNNMQYPPPVPEAKQYPFKGSLAELLANDGIDPETNEQVLWPATVYYNNAETTVNSFMAPIRKGLPVTSLPQKDRTITVTEEGVTKTKTENHPGVDIGTGGPGVQQLFACLPGVVYRGNQFKNTQPNTDKIAILNIVTPIKFKNGDEYNITCRYIHLSYFADATFDGNFVPQGHMIGYSGGAEGQFGSGGTTGPHLHWEVKTSGFNKTVSRVPAGRGGEALDCAPIYVGKSANPTNGSKSPNGAPPPQYDDSDLLVVNQDFPESQQPEENELQQSEQPNELQQSEQPT